MYEQLDVLSFTGREAGIYRRILEQLGFSRDPRIIDRMIAAQAIVAGATLATLNPRDFRNIPGLTIEDGRTSLSGRRHDVRRHRRIDAAGTFEPAEGLLDRFEHALEAARAAVGDFEAHRGAVAKRARRIVRRRAAAAFFDGLDLHGVEARVVQVGFDPRRVVIAERAFAHEQGRVVGKALDQHLLDDLGQRVALDPVPDRQQIAPAVAQHAVGLRVPGHAVGEEHGAELAHHEVEVPSSNGRSSASAASNRTLPNSTRRAAISSIGGLRSVATISASGSAAANACVTTPVPAAVSRMRLGPNPRARSASASA